MSESYWRRFLNFLYYLIYPHSYNVEQWESSISTDQMVMELEPEPEPEPERPIIYSLKQVCPNYTSETPIDKLHFL